ncbi:MAG: PEGA domain-containing protein [Spirochaetales bacterium]|nr:PEGA domain-containing protein [Spirochaetales bacterium]
MPEKILIPLLFLTIAVSAYSRNTEDTLFTEEELTLSKESWNIGLSSFSAGNLEARYEYLLDSIPLLLNDEITSLETHRLTDNEFYYYRNEYLKDQTAVLMKEKSALHKQRDSLLFSEQDRKERREKYKELSSDIEEKEREIESWLSLKAEDITLERELPVLFQEGTEGLIESRGHFVMEKSDLDLLFSGSIEQLDTLIYLEITAHTRTTGEPVFHSSSTVSEEEINSVIDEWSREIRTLILGRTWSGLRVQAEPTGAVLLVDGKSRGVGSLEIDDLEPGYVTVSAMSTGYKSESRQVYLLPGETADVNFNLEEGTRGVFYLSSDPPGADVYFGATWLGTTPLYTDVPDRKGQFRVVKDEFMPFYLPSEDLRGESLTVRLGSNIFDRQAELDLAKKKFYRSLGWFSLSVAVPVILAGVYQNLENRYIYTGSPEYLRQADIAYYSFWGGIAVSGGFLVNTLFKLRNYIKAAEKSTEE